MGFKIFGKVVEKETGKGIPNLTVKAFDKDLLFDDLLGAVTTDKKGYFEIKYDKEDFQEKIFDKKPDLYLKIKNPEGVIIHTTDDSVRYGAGKTERFIVKISTNKKEVKRMEQNEVNKAKEIMKKFDPALVATAVQEINNKRYKIEKDDVETAKEGIRKVYESLPVDKNRVEIISKAVTELDTEFIEKEIGNVKEKLADFDAPVLAEAVKDLDIALSPCSYTICICPEGCYKYSIGCNFYDIKCLYYKIGCYFHNIKCCYKIKCSCYDIICRNYYIGCGNRDIGCGNRDIGCSYRDIGCSYRDIGCSYRDIGCSYRDIGCSYRDIGCSYRDIGCSYRDIGCSYRDIGCSYRDIGCSYDKIGCNYFELVPPEECRYDLKIDVPCKAGIEFEMDPRARIINPLVDTIAKGIIESPEMSRAMKKMIKEMKETGEI